MIDEIKVKEGSKEWVIPGAGFSYIVKLLNYKNKVIMTIVNERIFMFIYKITYSLLTDKYHLKKLKYIRKYNILYNSEKCLEDLTD